MAITEAVSSFRTPEGNIRRLRFIGEPVEALFEEPPALEKRPGCPDEFLWRGKAYRIIEQLSEWHDYERRGRMAHNVRPTHAAAAEKRGSWGAGRDYYRIRTDSRQVFDIYFDRAPEDALDRKGGWFLYREIVEMRDDLQPT